MKCRRETIQTINSIIPHAMLEASYKWQKQRSKKTLAPSGK